MGNIHLLVVLLVCIIQFFDVESADQKSIPNQGSVKENTENRRATRNRIRQPLSTDESKVRLAKLVDQMDRFEKDGQISRDETVDWIYMSLLNQSKEQGEWSFLNEDLDEDGLVSFYEYMKSSYVYVVEELDEKSKKVHDELLKYDKKKFEVADLDHNGLLNRDEYHAFYHPWEYARMNFLEIEKALVDHDKNGDGEIELEEFLADDITIERDRNAEIEKFKSFDLNYDDSLTRNEIKNFAIPKTYWETAEKEADRLFPKSDADENGSLTKAEIVDQVDLWVDSPATDYGVRLKKILVHSEL